MNREIKFRALSFYKIMYYGLPYHSPGTGKYFMVYSNNWQPSYSNPDEGESNIFTPIDINTLSQFWRTHNGVDLYDGDIALIGGYLRVIRYDKANERMCFANIDDLKYEDRWCINQAPDLEWWQKYGTNIEVKGNIFENPELLK